MKNFKQKPVIFAGRGIPGEDVAGCGSISEGEAAGHPGISRSPELRINISFPSRCSSCALRGFCRGRSARSGGAAGRARGQSRRAGCDWMRVPAAGGLKAQPRRGSAGGGEGAAP